MCKIINNHPLHINNFLFFVFLTLSVSVKSQSNSGIGIGTSNVDPAAILDIRSTEDNKGLLIPRITQPKLELVTDESEGLLIYNKRNKRFSFYGSQGSSYYWQDLNLWYSSNVNNGAATYATIPHKIGVNMNAEPSVELEVNGTVKATTLEGYGSVPLGTIVMWSGDNIPDGYVLCDGINKSATGRATPNLVGKFIQGSLEGADEEDEGGGNFTTSRTQISYIHTPEYTVDGSNCQAEQFLYSFTYEETCETFGVVTIPVNNYRANSCAEAHADFFVSGECTENFTTCTTTPNPNYYLGKSACKNSDVRVVNAVTDLDKRPTFYLLAFIMRVE